VSRLVYMMALLEAVLWIQPNFALSWQHDMTQLLQTQTDNLSQLAQNVARDNIPMFQKQLEIIARELEMVARANEQIRNTQADLLDKGAARQASNFNPTERLPQLFAEANGGGGGSREHGTTAAGKSAAGAGSATSGAVPVVSNSQAYLVACCVLFVCFSAFSNEFSTTISESSDSDSVASPADGSSALKRPHEEEEEEQAEDSDDECDTTCASVKDCRRGRKRARLGAHVASSVHFGQAKKNNRHINKRHMKSNDANNCKAEVPCFSSSSSSSEVVSEDSILCSPTTSVSSGVASPMPVPVMASTVFSTLPPEMACDFEAEHSCYFHGIACPINSTPVMSTPVSPVHTYATTSPISASPVLDSPMFDHNADMAQRVIAIDPALLMDSSEHNSDAEDESTSENATAVAASAENATAISAVIGNAPLFGVSMEPLVQDVFYC